MPLRPRIPFVFTLLTLSLSAFAADDVTLKEVSGSSGKYFADRSEACNAAQSDARQTAANACPKMDGPLIFGACECSQGGFQEKEWLCSTTSSLTCPVEEVTPPVTSDVPTSVEPTSPVPKPTPSDVVAAASPDVSPVTELSLELPTDLSNLELLDRTFKRRGFTLPTDVLDQRLSAQCADGWKLACSGSNWKDSGAYSIAKASKSLENACITGDDDACVAFGWSLEAEGMATQDGSKFRAAARRYKALCDGKKNATACYDYGTILFNELGVKADPRLGLRRWESACTLGSAASCTALAKVHRTGLKTPKAIAKASTFANKACAAGDPGGCVEQALLQNDRVREQDQLARACSLGSVDTCWSLASEYLDGDRPEPVMGRTSKLLGLGCDLGDGRACTKAGELARNDSQDGTAGDRFRQACEVGHVPGCIGLVDLILTERIAGDVKDESYAFEVACSKGDLATACSELGLAMLDGDGLADNPRARALLRQSCTNETSPAKPCFVLGDLYETGKGGERDRTLAAQYYKWACAQGWGEACQRRGGLLAEGVGVRRDHGDAVVMYQAGCDAGLPTSCHAAGVLLDEGTYIPRDAKRAYAFFDTGCSRGVPEACLRLGNLALDSELGRDEVKARDAYESAVALDNIEAHRRLAYMLWNGIGGKKSKSRAKELTGIGCRNDDPVACRGPAFQTED